MEIRLANLDDYASVKKVYESVIADLKERNIAMWTGDYPLNVIKNDIENNLMYVLVDDSEVLGCFTLLENDEQYQTVKWQASTFDSLYIERLVINPRKQGRGLSKVIMNHIVNEIGQNYSVIRLTVLTTNERAISLYKKYGFLEVDRGTHMTKSGREASAMEKVK